MLSVELRVDFKGLGPELQQAYSAFGYRRFKWVPERLVGIDSQTSVEDVSKFKPQLLLGDRHHLSALDYLPFIIGMKAVPL